MIPQIFISSTIKDLQFLREALAECIQSLGYQPILSEIGDVGYLPDMSAEESCYKRVRDCHLLVLIVGSRYGILGQGGRGVTHNELLTAKSNDIPVITLVAEEVMTYKKLYDHLKAEKRITEFPNMDQPLRTFELLQQVMEASLNNGILTFSNVNDARSKLKKQLALLFGELLRSRFDPIRSGLHDVLSEIKTMRQELKSPDLNATLFLRTTRNLVDEENESLRHLLELVAGSIDSVVQLMMGSETLDEFFENAGSTIISIPDSFEILDTATYDGVEIGNRTVSTRRKSVDELDAEPEVKMKWGHLLDGRVLMNQNAYDSFCSAYEMVRE